MTEMIQILPIWRAETVDIADTHIYTEISNHAQHVMHNIMTFCRLQLLETMVHSLWYG